MIAYDKFGGLYIPTVTPFLPNSEVDVASLDRLARYQASIDGVAGLVSCARIGEGTVLSRVEKLQVFSVMGKAAHDNKKLHIPTIAPQSTAEAISMLKELEKLPVDAVMIFPPLLFAWGKVGGDLKFRFFEDLSKASSLPIVLFQIPVQSYWYDPETVSRIAALPTVVAFKEASFDIDLYTRTCQRLKKDGRAMRILTGNDRFVGKSYELGAVGALIGMANLAVDRWAELDKAGRRGDFRAALEIQEELKELSELVFAEPIVEAVARIKAILQAEGLIATASVRRPQLGITDQQRDELLAGYRRLTKSVVSGSKPLQQRSKERVS
jgi:4-hydroxy-tetrahydrodipicolinate synthase